MENRTAPLSPPSSGHPRILLVDCDMFYVQVARLEDPEGAGRDDLLIVGGSPAGRGVVTSASYAVREFGVHSGMPTAQALRLCPEARVVPVSRKACSRRSREVEAVLKELSPVVQAASIDEFYLDLSGTERMLHPESLADTSVRIQREVLRRTAISVSIGGGTRKLVAKLAAGRAKPGGTLVVPPGEEATFMRAFDLRDLPGIGPALTRALEARGLVAVEDLLAVEMEWLERWFGPRRARWLWERVRGRDPTPVNPSEPRKSISSEKTFSSDLVDDRTLEGELLKLVTSVGAPLRRKNLQGRTITVKIRDKDFQTRQASHSLPDPIVSDATIHSVARQLFRELRARRRTGVRLLGVGISSLAPGEGPPQLDLFHEGVGIEPERDRTISRLMDDLRERFGDEAILPGRLLERGNTDMMGEGSHLRGQDDT